MGSCELEISLFNCAEVSILFNAKSCVELGVVDLLRWASASGHAAHLFEIAERESASAAKEHCFCVVVFINLIELSIYFF